MQSWSETVDRVGGLPRALLDLLDQEFRPSVGHAAAALSTCVFAPSLLTFWLVNGVVDFSTAFAVGATAGPGGLVVRLVAYVLLVPAYVLLRAGFYLAHPRHRQSILSGTCPTADVLSLDWFSVGILATGLPLAFQQLGPWVGSNLVFALGLFVLPQAARNERGALTVKVAALALGTLLFVYARYGAALADFVAIPDPATTLGPVATLTLSGATVDALLSVTNSLTTGPLVVAGFALAMNRLLTRPELTSIPYFRASLPNRDPWLSVAASAALGTAFYLGVVALWTGRLSLVPAVL